MVPASPFGLFGGMLSFFPSENAQIVDTGQVGKALPHSNQPGDFATWAFTACDGIAGFQDALCAPSSCPAPSIRAFLRPNSDKMAFARAFYPGRFAAFVKAARQWKELAPRSVLSHSGCWIVGKRRGGLSTRGRGRGLAGLRHGLTECGVCRGKRGSEARGGLRRAAESAGE